MTPRSSLGPQYFSLPLRWRDRPEIIALPDGPKLLFVYLVEMCFTERNGGVMTYAQVQSAASSVSRGKQAVDRLIAAGCLSADLPLSSPCQPVAIPEPSRWHLANNPSPSIPPDQGKSLRANAENGEPGARARVKREKEREREEERTPSGSVRSSSAPAAPRGSEGAAQPALEDQDDGDTVDEFPELTGAAKVRAIAAAGQKRNKDSVGHSSKFWKYERSLNKLNEPSLPVQLSRDYE